MRQYQVGDIVEATEARDGLVKGEPYTVAEFTDQEGYNFVHVKDKNGKISGGWFLSRFKLMGSKMPEVYNEKVTTLADMLNADASKITDGYNSIYVYNNRRYWVVNESQKGNGAGPNWRWIGQLGTIHVYREKRHDEG